MPRISKARIVNFTFNDGKRLIADELFDFSSSDGTNALNALINLENGGGKTVLIQLLMQPILPKAKIGNRSISSFFTTPNSHCFIVLEWLKDNSPEKLLTGIAMAASDTTSSEEDTVRGYSVKYYTFYTNYLADDAAYSIINLPLSDKVNGRFIAADFSAIRQLAKNSRGLLSCCSSDDSRRWQLKLEEYGLSHNEWKMIETLNNVEGGLEKYFDQFKTSNALLDGLLIPTIERKFEAVHTTGDSSLRTMLLTYARQYAAHQEILAEKDTYTKFEAALEQLRPLSEVLWNADDQQKHTIRQAFGLLSALSDKAETLQQLQQTDEAQIQAVSEQKKQITWERISSHYYTRLDSYNEASRLQDMADAEVKRQEQALLETSHALSAMECANYTQKLRQVSAEIRVIQEQIINRENNLQSDHQLADLRYSAACQIDAAWKEQSRAAAQLHEQTHHLKQELTVQQKQLNRAAEEVQQKKSAYDRLGGIMASQKEETDHLIEQLNVDMMRRLDGFYAEEEWTEIQKEQHHADEVLRSQVEKTACKRDTCEAELRQIPEIKAGYKLEQNKLQAALQEQEQKLIEFRQEESQILAIFNQYSLDTSLRFTKHLEDYLLAERQKSEAQYANVLRKIAISEDALAAAYRGSVHVPAAVIDYLNSTQISYKTCEQYLLEIVDQKKLPKEKCLEILENYPAVAYGVLMEADTVQKFFACGREKWLPSMVPIFNHGQMDKILQLERKFSGAIAFYSEDYFSDKEHYIAHLEEEKQAYFAERDRLLAQKTQLDEQLQQARHFSYGETWETDLQETITRVKADIKTIVGKTEQCVRKEKKLEATRQTLLEKWEQLQMQQAETQKKLQLLDDIQNRMGKEQSLAQEMSHAHSEWSTSNCALEDRKIEVGRLQAQLQSFTSSIQTLENTLEDLNRAKLEVQPAPEAVLLPGTWQDLLYQYQALQKQLDADFASLQSALQDKADRQQEYQEEIAKRSLPEADFSALSYSSAQEVFLRQEKARIEAELVPARTAASEALQKSSADKALLEAGEKELEAYGGPLDKSQIGGNFEARTAACEDAQAALRDHQRQCAEVCRNINRCHDKLDNLLSEYVPPEQVPPMELQEDYAAQCECMKRTLCTHKKELEAASQAVEQNLQHLSMTLSPVSGAVADAVSGMTKLFHNELRGDRYYTLVMHIEGHIENAKRAVSKIEADLADFEHQHTDLIHQCVLQGQHIYTGLLQLQSSSRVCVHEGKPRQHMIRFDIPDAVDPAIATASITAEIDQGVREIVRLMRDPTSTEAEQKKHADKIVASKNLLRKYLGKEEILIEAYKIDQNPQNSRYRTWEHTQVNNSGAEKFVVYFAVILSLINYTRDDLSGLQNQKRCSVLILDNPFGSTSSRHILTPMFQIAKHFHVQLICLSHITQMDVVNCFDLVIRAMVRRRPLSSNELLTHEGNEAIEHGFYRTEQVSIF